MKISIITAAFNSARTVKDCLESVSAQSYPDIEHILIDGGSSDGTLEIARKHSASLRILSEKDKGIYDALNKGIKMAGGDIVGILNSDDFYAYKEALGDVVNLFNSSAAETCYGDLCYVSRENAGKIIRYWKSGDFKRESFKTGWMPPHPAFFARAEVYRKFGLFDISYRISADYELMSRFLFKNSVSSAYLPKVLVKMRLGGESNKSLGKITLKMREDYRIMREHGLGGVGTLFMKSFRKIPQFVSRGLED